MAARSKADPSPSPSSLLQGEMWPTLPGSKPNGLPLARNIPGFPAEIQNRPAGIQRPQWNKRLRTACSQVPGTCWMPVLTPVFRAQSGGHESRGSPAGRAVIPKHLHLFCDEPAGDLSRVWLTRGIVTLQEAGSSPRRGLAPKARSQPPQIQVLGSGL